ncbi:MAG: TRAP transporter large permease [Chloroflexota bacterium]
MDAFLHLNIILPMLLFLVLLVSGLPIAFAMGISGIIGLLGTFGLSATLGIVQSVPYRTVSTYTMTTIASFVLLAELAGQSGITEKLFNMANRFVGHLRGGLSMATIVASAAFGAISGSSVAAAATMSRIAVPQMLDAGYSKRLAAGSVAIAGTLAVLIPPSLVLIIYGVLTETSIGKLFLAGIVPGLVTTLGYALTTRIWIKISPTIAPPGRPRDGWRDRVSSLRVGWPFILVILAVLVALYSGVITATEAGAAGAGATFFVWMLAYRIFPNDLVQPGYRNVRQAVERALRTTTMILTLLIGAFIFSYFITSTGLTQALVAWVAGLGLNRYLVLLFIIVVYLILGLFLSQTEILVLTLPLVFPIIVQNGFDPVWFGIIIVKTVEVGLVTPPVGMNVYVVANSGAGVTAGHGFRGAVPYILVEILVIGLFVAFPEIVLFLPYSGAAL